MERILRPPVEGKVVYPIIYRVLAPSQVVGLGISEPSTVSFKGHFFSCQQSFIPFNVGYVDDQMDM